MLVVFGLRYTGWPPGVRMAIAWFVFSMLQSILFDRAVGVWRSRSKWLVTVVISIAGAALMGYLVQLD